MILEKVWRRNAGDNAGESVIIGGLYRPGVYVLEMIQGKEHKQIDLVSSSPTTSAPAFQHISFTTCASVVATTYSCEKRPRSLEAYASLKCRRTTYLPLAPMKRRALLCLIVSFKILSIVRSSIVLFCTHVI
jgi:hypothetical protein